MQLSPIIVFAYKRPNELMQTLTSLKANYLSAQSDLYIFVDGPKRPEDKEKVEAVKQIVDKIDGFKNIYRAYSEKNHGLASSVIKGVSEVIEKHGTVIVLEDDLITSPNFLDYMNKCLKEYGENRKVFSITGYSFPFSRPENYNYDAYFFPRTGSWGWATWRDRWEKVDWSVLDYERFIKDPDQRRDFNFGGIDRVRMLKRQQNGEVDSWAIRFCYSQFKNQALTVHPAISKVQNIGFYTNDGTHTNVYNRYTTVLDSGESTEFCLPKDLSLNLHYVKQFQSRFHLLLRAWNKLKTISGMR